MTLKEKFQNIDDEGKTWNQIYDLQEQIADDLAIEFAQWVQFHSELWIKYKTSELLQLFKKEKGL